MIIKAIIFDLDNCLAATREIGIELVEPAFAAIRRHNRGELSEDCLQAAFADIWRHPLDWVAERYGFSAAMREAAWQAFTTMEVDRPMRGYDDLAVLAELAVTRFLVTSGFRRLQQSKIDALHLATLFAGILIDAIDDPGRKGKEALFAEILHVNRWRANEVLVVGDSAESEIAAGNRLGIGTVQILRPGVPRSDTADFHITTLKELPVLLAD